MKPTLVAGLLGLGLAAAGAFWAWSILDERHSVSPPGPAATGPQPEQPATAAAPVPAPVAQIDPNRPSFDVVRISPSGDAVIAGRSLPGAVVTIEESGRELGQVVADARGEWVFVTNAPLAPGTRELALSATAPGGVKLHSEQVVVMVVPERALTAAGSRPSPAATAEPALAVAVPSAAAGFQARASVLLQGAERGGGQGELWLDTADFDESGAFVLAGRAPAGATAQIYLDNRAIGTATADAQGRWQLAPGERLGDGQHALRIDQIDADGKVVARIETPLAFTPIGDLMAPGERIVVQRGETLWRMAQRAYGSGFRYTVIYDSNRGRIRDPNLIYPGQVIMVPKTN